VLISAKVGENESIRWSSSNCDIKNEENINIKSVLIAKCSLLFNVERNQQSGRTTTSKKRKTNKKVRPFFCNKCASSGKAKWSNLPVSCYNKVNNDERVNKCYFFKNLILNINDEINRTRINSNLLGVTNEHRIGLFQVLNALVRGIMLKILLVRQNVERNPGEKKVNFTVTTVNCNGLGNKVKLQEVLRVSHEIVKKNGIVFLQETHLTDESYLKQYWKNKYENNGYKTNSAGVTILYPNDFKNIYTFKSNNGRYIITVLESELTKLIISTIYCPNDHSVTRDFLEEFYDRLMTVQEEHPDSYTIIGGDLNTCVTKLDCKNRIISKSEEEVGRVIEYNNEACGLKDGYRIMHSTGGYTWKRGNCYSRLDYLFISEGLAKNISYVDTDWAFGKTDHAAVKMGLTFNEEIKKGPGTIKLNMNLLSNKITKIKIGEEIKTQLDQIPVDWDPHKKLEFAKVVIRSVWAQQTSHVKQTMIQDIDEASEALNSMEKYKISLIENNLTQDESQNTKIEGAVNHIKLRLEGLRKNLEEVLTFKSRAKWYEYGEKSNSFFLNLNKHFTKQKLISEISENGTIYIGQNKVMSGIRSFYEALYRKKDLNMPNDESDEFYKHCPKLSENQKSLMDNKLSFDELRQALQTCKESAPGQDGITYRVYKEYWNILGPHILNA
jgi:exonuclease III